MSETEARRAGSEHHDERAEEVALPERDPAAHGEPGAPRARVESSAPEVDRRGGPDVEADREIAREVDARSAPGGEGEAPGVAERGRAAVRVPQRPRHEQRRAGGE